MNSIAAVDNALKRQAQAHIPLGVYAIDCDTAGKILGRKTLVRDKIGLQLALWDGRRDEVAEEILNDAVELYKKLDCIDLLLPAKCVPILPPRGWDPPKVKKLDDSTWEDAQGKRYKAAWGTNEIVSIEDGKREEENIDFEDRNFSFLDESVFEIYDQFIDAFAGKRYICGHAGGFRVMVLLGGMENGLMEYYLNPPVVRRAIAYYTAQECFLDSQFNRPGLNGFFMENDFASTTGPLMSAAMFRDFCFAAMCDRVNSGRRYQKQIMLHSCGNTWDYLPMFIEAGFDLYQSLQTGVMRLPELTAKYGSQLSFWGGVPVESLISGTSNEVRQAVRDTMAVGKESGGVIVGPSHSIAYGTNYDNFMSMLDEYSRLS